MLKYLLSFFILLLSCIINPNASAESVSANAFRYGEIQLNHIDFAQYDQAFITIPSSGHHHQSVDLEAIEVEVQEDEVVGSSKFLAASHFATFLLVVLLGLFINQASQALQFRRHFFFFTSFSPLFIRLRVIRL